MHPKPIASRNDHPRVPSFGYRLQWSASLGGLAWIQTWESPSCQVFLDLGLKRFRAISSRKPKPAVWTDRIAPVDVHRALGRSFHAGAHLTFLYCSDRDVIEGSLNPEGTDLPPVDILDLTPTTRCAADHAQSQHYHHVSHSHSVQRGSLGERIVLHPAQIVVQSSPPDVTGTSFSGGVVHKQIP